jgi:hypothetical protein
MPPERRTDPVVGVVLLVVEVKATAPFAARLVKAPEPRVDAPIEQLLIVLAAVGLSVTEPIGEMVTFPEVDRLISPVNIEKLLD